MTSNSANMTPSEKLAEKLKNDSLGTLMDDEMIADLAKEAIKIAFFQPRKGDGWNSRDLDPLAVELAKEAFKEAVKVAMAPVVEGLAESDDFKLLIGRAVIEAIPTVARETVHGLVSQASQNSSRMTLDHLNTFVGQTLGVDFNTGARR